MRLSLSVFAYVPDTTDPITGRSPIRIATVVGGRLLRWIRAAVVDTVEVCTTGAGTEALGVVATAGST
jgi:hypothetical protein